MAALSNQQRDEARRNELVREMHDLLDKNAKAGDWGAAVGARQERINAIRRELERRY